MKAWTAAPMADGNVYVPLFSANPVLSATLFNAGAPTVPQLVTSSNTEAAGGMLTFYLDVTQWGNTVTTLDFTISIDLVLKS